MSPANSSISSQDSGVSLLPSPAVLFGEKNKPVLAGEFKETPVAGRAFYAGHAPWRTETVPVVVAAATRRRHFRFSTYLAMPSSSVGSTLFGVWKIERFSTCLILAFGSIRYTGLSD